MRNSDEVKVGVDADQLYSDNNSMTLIVRSLKDDPSVCI